VLGEANVDLPKGTLDSKQTDLYPQHQRITADARGLQQSDHRLSERLAVRVRDIGQPGRWTRERFCSGRLDEPANGRSFWRSQRAPGANGHRHGDRVLAMLPQLGPSIPPTIKGCQSFSDRTQTIRGLGQRRAFNAGCFSVRVVVMVIFLFLRNVWATLIPAVTVPLSLDPATFAGAVRARLQPRQSCR